MLDRKDLRKYQEHCVQHVLDHESAGLLLDMGLGKSVSTLTALNELIFERFEVEKPLIIAPKLVAEHTWSDEIAKWAHLNHLKLVKILGDEKERKRALRKAGDIYIINRENVVWLVNQYGLKWPFDMVVIDELSSFKNRGSNRFKYLKAVRPQIKRIVGLTGTPCPNGLLDLWAQLYLLDQGQRLEGSFEGYKTRYFKKDPYKPYSSFEVIRDKDEKPGEGMYEKKIYDKISDICISLKKEDWLDMPALINVTREVHLSEAVREQYENFERDEVLKLAELGDEISPPNKAALINKLLQFSNGAVYYEDGTKYHEIHDEKIEMLRENIEEANGNPILITYQFQSDVERIRKKLKEFKPVHIKDHSNTIKDWNARRIPVLLGHPASMGHGLNLQFGGNLITHFGVGWNLEQYLQVIDRLNRPGVDRSVINTRLICKDTWEPNVLQRLESKTIGQEALMQAVKALFKKHGVSEALL